MEHVWISFGSNLNNPKKQVDRAVWAMSNLPATKLLALSSYYRSSPLGDHKNQPDFLNAVALLKTNLTPENLLNFMQKIELQQGRVRALDIRNKWISRTLDLDILLFDKYIINTDKLVIPHYDMNHREFVLFPLLELERNLVIPVSGKISNIIKSVPRRGLTLWE